MSLFAIHLVLKKYVRHHVSDTTVYEEAELLDQLPLLPPGGSHHYAFPACNTNFPDMTPPKTPCKLRLAGCVKLTLDGASSKGAEVQDTAEVKVKWSAGIDIQSEHDVFVHIPDLSDVKAHIEKVGQTTHVFLDRMSRAEISAREIRSRIQGQDRVSMVKTHRPSAEKSHDQSHDLSLDQGNELGGRTSPRSSRPVHIQPQVKTVIELDVLIKTGSLTLLDESTNPRKARELVRVTGDKIFASCHPKANIDMLSMVWPHLCQNVLVCVGDLQVDNQAYPQGSYDFPVFLVKQSQAKQLDFDEAFMKLAPAAKVDSLQNNSFLVLSLLLCTDLVDAQTSLDSVDLSMKPVLLYVEDTFIYEILNQIDRLLPPAKAQPITSHRCLPREVKMAVASLMEPIRLQQLTIQPISMLLSVHASLKLFIASDTTPLKFSKFERRGLYTTSQQLISTLAMHYATGALFRAGGCG